MILTCPACSAQYLLPDESIGSKGRRVKCTTCDYTWLQRPELIEDSQAFVIPEYFVQDTANPEEFSAPPKPRITPVVADKSTLPKAMMIGLAIGIIAVIATLGMAAGIRKDIVARAPASALLFEKIGVPVDVPGKGLSFDAVTAQINKSTDNKDLLAISGKLFNNTRKDIKLPRLLIRLNGSAGWLKDWPVYLYGKVVQSGTTNDFTYDLKDVPADGKTVTLLFAD